MQKYVAITGVSRGIGAATAELLLSQGWGVIGCSRTAPESEILRCAAEDRAFLWVQADVGDRAALEDGLDETLRGMTSVPELRALVVNAGIGVWAGVLDATPQDWRAMFSTNLDGAFNAIQCFLGGRFALSEDAQLLTIGSDAALAPFNARAAYCASKAGLSMLVDCARVDLRPRRIRVTEIRPSRVDTGFRNKVPGSRPGSLRPEDIAGTVHTILALPSHVEIRALDMASIDSSFGN